jgi:hypothetical protein
MNSKYYVVYWTKWEGFIFQSVPTLNSAEALSQLTGFHSILTLEVPSEPAQV